MTTEEKTEIIDKLRAATSDLAQELAMMHGTLLNLITNLRTMDVTEAQRVLLDAAMAELKKSQKHFFATYMDDIGGAKPENN
jgi:predicted negative regulator of RcsB-dependent stress response